MARAFTGWTIQNPRMGGGFRVRSADPRSRREGRARARDQGRRAAESDGEQVLDILATHPSTARFISTKLARRFVSDTPPPALVDRMAATFRRTDGDLREVMRTLLTLAGVPLAGRVPRQGQDAVRVRRQRGARDRRGGAGRARRSCARCSSWACRSIMCQPPTGYKDTADAWVNTGALVNRMNFALQLAGNNLRGGGRGPSPADDRPLSKLRDALQAFRPHHRDGAQQRRLGHDARDDREGDDARADARAHAGLAGISETLRLSIAECRFQIEGHHDFAKSLPEERRVRAGQPRVRALVPGAHGVCRGRGRAGETAHRHLSARRGRRPQHDRAVRRQRTITARGRASRSSGPARRPSDGALDLDGFFGFNPRLQPLKPFWDARQLAIVHACGSPDTTRSHFDAQDYMEIGHARRQEHVGRLAESVPSGAARRRGDAVSRRRADAAAAARAAGHRAGAGDQSDRTVRDPRRAGERDGRSVVREPSSPRPPIMC